MNRDKRTNGVFRTPNEILARDRGEEKSMASEGLVDSGLWPNGLRELSPAQGLPGVYPGRRVLT